MPSSIRWNNDGPARVLRGGGGPIVIENLRFLVVEDHSFQRWMLASLLQSLGATQVFSAPDGQAALGPLADLEPAVDIVITDLDMPGMDGMEFIRHLGENWRHVSLVVVSGLDAPLI